MRDAILGISSVDSNANLIDVHSGQTVHTFKPCTSFSHGVYGFQYQHSPSFISIHKDRSLIHLYSYQQPILKCPCPEKLSCITISTSSNFIFAGAESGQLYMWDRPSGQLLNTWQAHFQSIQLLLTSLDGDWFVTAGQDAVIKVYEFANLMQPNPIPLYTFNSHTLPITDAVLTSTVSSMSRLLTCSLDRTLQIHCLATGQLISSFHYPTPLSTLALHPMNTIVYTGHTQLYQTSLTSLSSSSSSSSSSSTSHSLSTITTYPLDQGTLTHLVVTPTYLVASTNVGQVLFYDLTSMVLIRTFNFVHPIIQLIYFPLLSPSKDQWSSLHLAPLSKFKSTQSSTSILLEPRKLLDFSSSSSLPHGLLNELALAAENATSCASSSTSMLRFKNSSSLSLCNETDDANEWNEVYLEAMKEILLQPSKETYQQAYHQMREVNQELRRQLVDLQVKLKET